MAWQTGTKSFDTGAVAAGSQPAIALDTSDRVHISLLQEEGVAYAQQAGEGWITERVATGDFLFYRPTL